MGKRKITIKKSVADSIAQIGWFIEAEGMIAAADKFSDDVYDFFERISDDKRSFAVCREPKRAAMGYKCLNFRKKYTVVVIESESEIVICEFVSSKLLNW